MRIGIGSDSRITCCFFYAACRYGASRFPRDVDALVGTAKETGDERPILPLVERVNNVHTHMLGGNVTQVRMRW